MVSRAAALVLALAWAGAGCGAKKGEGTGAVASASAAPAVSARRPTRRYFLARTKERCEIYSVDGPTRTEPTKTPCPQEIEVGERIRIAGRTCTRETDEPARRLPVVCPDPLTNLERSDHRAAMASASATASTPAP